MSENPNYEKAKADFVVFMANPERKQNIKEFANQYNIPETTVYSWQKTDWFRKALIKECSKYLLPNLPIVYKALVDACKAKQIPAIQLFLRQCEILLPEKTQQEITVKTPAEEIKELLMIEEEFDDKSSENNKTQEGISQEVS